MSDGYIGTAPATRDPTVSDDSVTTSKLADNSVTGPKVDINGNAQGDIMYYSGTDWVLLTAASATSGQAILSGGAGANPTWGSAGDFKDGGDTATANRVLGNNDAYSLGFETSGSTRLSIAANGFMTAQEGFGIGNTQTVDATISTPASENIMSVGPITIDTGVTVTIGTSGNWIIV